MTTGRINQVAVRRVDGKQASKCSPTDNAPPKLRPEGAGSGGHDDGTSQRRADTGPRRDSQSLRHTTAHTAEAVLYSKLTVRRRHLDARGAGVGATLDDGRFAANNAAARLTRRRVGTANFHSRSDDPLRDPNLQDCRVLNLATPDVRLVHFRARDRREMADHPTPQLTGRLYPKTLEGRRWPVSAVPRYVTVVGGEMLTHTRKLASLAILYLLSLHHV